MGFDLAVYFDVRFVALFFQIIAVLLSIKLTAVAQICGNLFKAPSIQNFNAQRSAEDYRQTNSRDIREYESKIRSLREKTRRLKSGDIYVEQGGGKGIAATQIAIATGARTIIINPQDFSPYFSDIAKIEKKVAAREYQLIYRQYKGRKRLIGIEFVGGKCGISRLATFSEMAGIEPPTYLKFLSEEIPPEEEVIHADLVHILKVGTAAYKKANITYRIGLAEEILPALRNQVSLLVDVYAAFYYSPYRLRVVEEDYRSLKVGGEALIYFGDGPFGTHVDKDVYDGDQVFLKSGSQINLLEFLVSKFPNIFSLGTDGAGTKSTLIMKKNSEVTDLNLENVLEVVSEDWYTSGEDHSDGYAVPKLIFKEK